MKFLLRIIIVGTLCFLGSFLFPWWCMFIISFIVGFIVYGNDVNVFLSGFIAIGVLWLLNAWKLNVKTDAMIGKQVIELFGYEDPFTLVIYAGLIGATVGGLGCLAGNSFRKIYVKEKKKRYYS